MKKYIIDRIENEYAICVDEKNKRIDIKLNDFGFEIKEGLFVLYDENTNLYYKDKENSEKVKEINKSRLNKLFDR